jgi:peptidoglycan lytic transglycosylase B
MHANSLPSRISGVAKMRLAMLGIASILLVGDGARPALADAFDNWVTRLWPEARALGVSRATFDAAFRGVRPDESIYESAGNQPEFVRPIWEYVGRATSDQRIETGQEKLQEFASVLDAIEAVYGVDRNVVLAIWGMESNYGGHLGDKNVIEALATLGYSGRRQRFGRRQVLAALQILERRDITPELMTGSWAGAMGHTQFIPTTYNAYAVDFDGDGRRDIWQSIADALGSTANYLRVSGWQPGKPWGYEVKVPDNFDFSVVGTGRRAVSEWQRLGLRLPGGGVLPHPADEADFILPAGAGGPAFLTLRNFRAILRYNNATAYALSVGHLSDRIGGADNFAQNWPEDALPLTHSQKVELQQLLNRAGFPVGAADGVVGQQTRAGIRRYQRSVGLVPDGYASLPLLSRLKS